jgi:ubiquinone/menaquinone biosynthesis C-methylase UbiE
MMSTFDEGVAFQVPYAVATFDRVASSLVIHHLTTEDKQRALDEAFRILKSGDELLVLDFGKPHNPLAWLISRVVRRLERTECRRNQKGVAFNHSLFHCAHIRIAIGNMKR